MGSDPNAVDPDDVDIAAEDDDLTPEEIAAVRASQADPDTPPADDPDAG